MTPPGIWKGTLAEAAYCILMTGHYSTLHFRSLLPDFFCRANKHAHAHVRLWHGRLTKVKATRLGDHSGDRYKVTEIGREIGDPRLIFTL